MPISYKSISIAVLCFLFCNLYAQPKQTKKENDLQPVSFLMEYSWMNTSPWDIYHHLKLDVPAASHQTTKGVNLLIDSFLNEKPANDNKARLASREFALVKQYKDNLHNLFNSMDELKGLKPDRYFTIALPVQFRLNTDSGVALVITGADIDTVYNSEKLTLEQRTASILLNYILPSLKVFTANFKDNQIKYYGVNVLYSSFGEGGTDKTNAEWTGFLAPVDLIRKYTAGEISAVKLMEKAEVTSGYNAYSEKNKKLIIDLNLPIPNVPATFKTAAKDDAISKPSDKPAGDASILTSYSDDNISFSYPAYWTKTNDKAFDVSFGISKSSIFQVLHNNNYDDVVKYADMMQQNGEGKNFKVYQDNAQLGSVYAIRMIWKGKVDGIESILVFYFYKDVEDRYTVGKKITTVEYGGHFADFAEMEPQVVAALNTLKFKTRTYGYKDFYLFEYPIVCEAKEYYPGSVAVQTNCPINKLGNLLNAFNIIESKTKPGDKSVEDLLKQKEKEFKKAGYKNVTISNVTIGAKPGRMISYVSNLGTTKSEAFVMHKGSMFWFQFDPRHDTEDAYNATIALVMSSFKWKE